MRHARKARLGVAELAAGLLVFLLPVRALSPLASSILSIGAIIAVLLLPVALGSLPQYRWWKVIVGTVLAAAVTTAALIIDPSGRAINESTQLGVIVVAVSAFVQLIVLLWARTYIGTRAVALAYSAGLVAQTLLAVELTHGNPWKFGLAAPVTVGLLALIGSTSRAWTVITLISAAALSAATGFRSFFGICVITLAVWLWNTRPRGSRAIQVAFIAAVGFVVYWVGTVAALAGWLGERNQLVTQQQIAEAGSVLAGGRVESAAAVALFMQRPLGYGPGVMPNASDLTLAQTALVSRGVNVEGEFVADYLFGTGIKLHSVAADLWVNFGLGGLFLAVVFTGVLAYGIWNRLGSPGSPAFYYLTAFIALWNVAFSPIGTNLWSVVFGVALLLPLRGSEPSSTRLAHTELVTGVTSAALSVRRLSRPSRARRRAHHPSGHRENVPKSTM